MAVTVRIPTTMRPLAGGASTVEVEPGSLSDVIKALDHTHAGFAERLLDDGALRKFVNVFVDDDDVRYLERPRHRGPRRRHRLDHPRRRRRLSRFVRAGSPGADFTSVELWKAVLRHVAERARAVNRW